MWVLVCLWLVREEVWVLLCLQVCGGVGPAVFAGVCVEVWVLLCLQVCVCV